MAGRDALRETVRIAIERVRLRLPTKSILIVGLRGIGKTVLLDRMRDDAGFARALKVKYQDTEVDIDREPEPGLADNGDLEHDLRALLEAVGAACSISQV